MYGAVEGLALICWGSLTQFLLVALCVVPFSHLSSSLRSCVMQCRDMPGYPKVDRESDYLIARYDGAVLDAKPWGRGALGPALSAQSLGYTGQQAVVLQQLLQKEVCLSLPGNRG